MGWRTLWVAPAAAIVLAFTPAGGDVQAAGEACPGARVAAKRSTIDQAREAVLCEINRVRGERGLGPLASEDRLGTAAQRHSADMVERRYFGHVSPGGQDITDRARRTGYVSSKKGWGLGENLAWATRARATAERTVALWMDSPPHRAVLLERRYTDAGIGIADGVPQRRRRAGATITLMVGWRS